MVIRSGVLTESIERFHRTTLRIQTTKNQPRETRLKNSPHTHNTRLQGCIERASAQAPTPKIPGGVFKRQDLCVGNGALQLLSPVMASTDNLVPIHDHGSNRDFFSLSRFGRLLQRQPHVIKILTVSVEKKIVHKTALDHNIKIALWKLMGDLRGA